MRDSRTPTYIDLFAGCGGLSLGLYKAGWTGLFAVEKDRMAFETLKHNLIDKKNHFLWPKWLPCAPLDINKVIKNYSPELKQLAGKIDLIAGGPPCQGFSFAGRRMEGDFRNKLVYSYLKFIRLVKPKLVFFENVTGFTIPFRKNKSSGIVYSSYVAKQLEKIGYNVMWQVIDFSDFGVPQRRKRFILVGFYGGDAAKFFKEIRNSRDAYLDAKGLTTKISLFDAISDLERSNGEVNDPDFGGFQRGIYSKPKSNYQTFLRREASTSLPDSHRFANHEKTTLARFELLLTSCSITGRVSTVLRRKFGIKKHSITILRGAFISPTLTTLPDDFIHYSEPRILTVREYARIQTFDDWFEFKGKYTTGGKRRTKETPRYTQVGNAVPPLFAEQAGTVLREMTSWKN